VATKLATKPAAKKASKAPAKPVMQIYRAINGKLEDEDPDAANILPMSQETIDGFARLVDAGMLDGDVVKTLQQSRSRELVERECRLNASRLNGRTLDVDHDGRRWIAAHRIDELAHEVAIDLDRDEAVAERVVPEDVGESWCDHRAKPGILQRPYRVLARRAAPEVRAGEQYLRSLVAHVIEDERRVFAPGLEETRAVPGAFEPLEPVARDDLVGVDVRACERQRSAGDAAHRFHQRRSDGSAK